MNRNRAVCAAKDHNKNIPEIGPLGIEQTKAVEMVHY